MRVVQALPDWLSEQIHELKERPVDVNAWVDGVFIRIAFAMPNCHLFEVRILNDSKIMAYDIVKFYDYAVSIVKEFKMSKGEVRTHSIRGQHIGIDVEHKWARTDQQVTEHLESFIRILEQSQQMCCDFVIGTNIGRPTSLRMISNRNYIRYVLKQMLQDVEGEIKFVVLTCGDVSLELKCIKVTDSIITHSVLGAFDNV